MGPGSVPGAATGARTDTERVRVPCLSERVCGFGALAPDHPDPLRASLGRSPSKEDAIQL